MSGRHNITTPARMLRLTILLLLLFFSMPAAGSTVSNGLSQSADRVGTQWGPYLEWSLRNTSYNGNAYDLEASVTFTHSGTGKRHTTAMFYDGNNTWKFRFTGTEIGTWSFVSSSNDSDLDGYRGTVTINPNSDPRQRGFVSSVGNQWTRTATGEAFVPQFVMVGGPQYYYNNSSRLDRDIQEFIIEHKFNGFHVPVFCRWFDISEDACWSVNGGNPGPDDRTFDALEEIITRVYNQGGTVHLWMWGDSARGQNPSVRGDWGRVNGQVDRRLQRYIAARLGPIPGWTIGYGFDLHEWASGSDLTEWHDRMQDEFGWPHMLGARSSKNQLNQLSEAMDYSSYEQHRPNYNKYVETIERRENKPSFSEDRFRVRNEGRSKDYDFNMTRRGLWESTMAGGVANIWGNLSTDISANTGTGTSLPYPNKDEIRTYFTFWEDRFELGMTRCNNMTDAVCLKSADGKRIVIYAQGESSISLDLSSLDGPLQAVLVDARDPYREIPISLDRNDRRYDFGSWSDWAIAITVGDAPTNTPPVANAGPDQTVMDSDGSGAEDVRLNGTSSGDTDGSIQSYRWTNGSDVTANGATPTVSVDVGMHNFTLTVTDDSGATATDTVNVMVEEAPPTDADLTLDLITTPVEVNAGEILTYQFAVSNQGPAPATNVTLNGRLPDGVTVQSMSDGCNESNRSLSCGLGNLSPDEQTQVEVSVLLPDGVASTLSLSAVVQADQPDPDEANNSVASNIQPGAPQANREPVANPGADQTVTASDAGNMVQVVLDGSGSSDPDGSIASYVWTENGTQIATGPQPTVSLNAGTHTITLTVTDNEGATATGTVIVTVNPYVANNMTPMAEAGPNQTLSDANGDGVEQVTLDGSASSDADGTIASYVWMENNAAIATGANTNAWLTVGSHTITLTVTDDAGDKATDTVTITVEAVPVPTPPPPPPAPGGRVGEGLVVLYTFDEGSGSVVNDVSGNGAPLSLNIRDMDAVDWRNGILHVHSSTLIESPGAASKVTNAVMATNEITIEAWVAADNLWQTGPARIVTLSLNADRRNVTLGQGVSRGTPTAFTARLRTTVRERSYKDYNRTHTDADVVQQGVLQHVVFTRDASGRTALYVDGVLLAEGIADGDMSSWDSTWKLGLANEFSSTDRPWRGQYDLVAIYNRALTAEQISQNFNVTGDDPPPAPNQPPYVEAGPDQTVVDNNDDGLESVNLDAVGSGDPDGEIVSYLWTLDDALVASGGTATTNVPVGTYTLLLTVTDNDGATATDMLTITVEPHVNVPPVADAGPDRTEMDSDGDGRHMVMLDASGSNDSDGSIVMYQWMSGGVEVATGMNAGVDLAVGTHEVMLKVMDDDNAEHTDTVMVTVDAPPNQPPVANAGADLTVVETAATGTADVTLDGSGSADPDGTIASYSWSLGGEIGTGANPTVSLPVGTHEITLTVTDDAGATATDTVMVVVEAAPNQPPVANAGPDQTVVDTARAGSVNVPLDGSGSADPDSTIANYSWSLGGEIGTGANPTVSLPVGTHEITLVVTDDAGAQNIDTVVVVVEAPPNQPPVANAGPDQTVMDANGDGAENVVLDGSGSSDPDGSVGSFQWMLAGSEIGTGANPTLSLQVGTHEITLVVTDDAGAQNIDSVLIAVNAQPNQPPVPNAGPDQAVIDANGDGSEPVTLDGSGSMDPDGSIASYSWTNGGEIGTGINPVVNLPSGVHTITLTVTDNNGAAMSDAVQIEVQAAAPPPPPAPVGRNNNGVIALYTFDEGGGNVVNDTSGNGAPLNLTVADPNAVTWGAGMLSVNSETIISSGVAASKIINGVMATQEITLEAWIVSADASQLGPARIVTLSQDADNRNFTLGQGIHRGSPTAYTMRLRTTVVPNRDYTGLSTPEGTVQQGTLQHLLYTRNAAGETRLYVNGTLIASGTAAGDMSNWDPNWQLALANELNSISRPFRGTYDLVAIFNRALSAEEVMQNFNAGP